MAEFSGCMEPNLAFSSIHHQSGFYPGILTRDIIRI